VAPTNTTANMVWRGRKDQYFHARRSEILSWTA